MPIYEFHCEKCEQDSEILVRSSHWEGTECPRCGSTKLAKKFSTFASAGAGGGGGFHDPFDLFREVFGAGRKQISTFPLVGGTTVVMGLLMSLIFFTDIPGQEMGVLGAIVGVMILFGLLMWYFGKKSEIRSAAQYTQKGDGKAQ